MMASVVSIIPATEAALSRALLETLAGSMTPKLTMSPNSPVAALKPKLPFSSLTRLTITEPSTPALLAICLVGSTRDFLMISTPVAKSPVSFKPFSFVRARIRATPPPGTIPSSTAALVACIASSTRAFFSFISVSEAAPTLMTATPPTSLAKRSCNFSLS